MKKKYVDDLSMLEAIDLKSTLVPCPTTIGPANFHEQPGLCLPPEQTILQYQLKDLLEFTNNWQIFEELHMINESFDHLKYSFIFGL